LNDTELSDLNYVEKWGRCEMKIGSRANKITRNNVNI